MVASQNACEQFLACQGAFQLKGRHLLQARSRLGHGCERGECICESINGWEPFLWCDVAFVLLAL